MTSVNKINKQVEIQIRNNVVFKSIKINKTWNGGYVKYL